VPIRAVCTVKLYSNYWTICLLKAENANPPAQVIWIVEGEPKRGRSSQVLKSIDCVIRLSSKHLSEKNMITSP
jgi:hypothetical protein